MEDILRVYERPFDPGRPLICMDEASKELHTDVRAPEPMTAGHPRREDAEYGRHGTASIFLYSEPLTGWCHVEARERRTASTGRTRSGRCSTSTTPRRTGWCSCWIT